MLIQSILSYDSNILLAAIISLLLVILFILLLHVYAKWFLVHARRRSRNSVDSVLGPSRLRHFNTYNLDAALFAFPSKGLEASAIASIPVFVYEPADDEQRHHGLECVVCLSVFEEGEVGRKLPKCGHGFHVECIDMWLSSHSSCPICRAPAAVAVVTAGTDLSEDERVISRVNRGEHELEIIVLEVPSSDENENENENIVIGTSDSSSSSSPSSSLSSQAVALGGTLKRMLSKKSDCKVHPSAAAAVSEMDNI